jgi:hypothetical protein
MRPDGGSRVAIAALRHVMGQVGDDDARLAGHGVGMGAWNNYAIDMASP